MKRVVIESPFKGANAREQAANVEYAKACMLDSLKRGEAPFASHLLYTQVLDDAVAEEREMGIAAGLAFVRDADLTAVYINRGVSAGMLRGVEAAGFANRPYDVRVIDAPVWGRGWLNGPETLENAWKRGRRTGEDVLDESVEP
jgi:hypothetical protein